MIWPTLYKISSLGKVQVWDVQVIERDSAGVIQIAWGAQDGKIQTTEEIVREGKNLGKKNETTPMEQALDQARSRWEKQKDRYYAESVEEATTLRGGSTRPMLAQKHEDRKHRLKRGETVFLQPKLDGMRCIAVRKQDRVDLISRGQKPITAVPQVAETLLGVMEVGEVWDGELYLHGMALEDIISACRPKKPNDVSLTMEYHIFDAIEQLPYPERFLTGPLHRIVAMTDQIFIKAVPTKEVPYDPDKTDQWREKYEADGWEGMIIRLGRQEVYEHKKTMNLLKDKSFSDDEFVIVGAQTAKEGGRKHGLLVNFVCQTTNAKGEPDTFEATLMGKEDRLREMWPRKEEFIGKLATVRYQDLTKKGLPHFGKVKGIRWEGDMDPRIDLTQD